MTNHLQSNLLKGLLLGLSALSACYFGFIAFDTHEAVSLVKHWGYWIMALTIALLGVNACLECKQHLDVNQVASRLQKIRLPVAFIVCASAILFVMQPTGYKVTMDEPVLASTAMRMHAYKDVMTTVRAHEIQGVFMQLDGYVDKRPYFFPFLVSLLHDLTGYRSQNLFILNGLMTPVFLGLLFYLGRAYASTYGGYFAVLLFSTVPLLAMNVNGGGFELLNMTMIMITLLVAKIYLDSPDVRRLNLLVLTGVLLAQTRYESALYIAAVGLIVVIGWIRRKKMIISLPLIISPLLLVPFAWQQIIFSSYEELWQYKDGATQPFSLSFIPRNLQQAADYFFNLSDDQQPNSLLLSVLFVTSLGYLGVSKFRLIRAVDLRDSLVITTSLFCAIVLFNFGLLMSYHWGQINEIIATRIVLPFILFQVLFVVCIWGRALDSVRLRHIFAGISLLFFVGVTVPLCARSDFLRWVPAQQFAVWLQEEVKSYRDKSVLFVSQYHLVPLVEQVPAITEFAAKQNKARIDLHQNLGTYGEVLFAFQAVRDLEDPTQFKPTTPLLKDFDLEIVSESQMNDDVVMRIGRLKAVIWRGDDSSKINLADYEPSLSNAKRRMWLAQTLP